MSIVLAGFGFSTPPRENGPIIYIFLFPPTKLSTRVLKPQRSFFSCPKPIFPTQIFYSLTVHTSTGTSTSMNGHFRRDPDVISRLPDTTTQDLSVFIGFRCSNSFKIVILDENIGFVWFFKEKYIIFLNFYFVPGIILDHFRHPKSNFWYPKLKILRNFTKKQFIKKSICLHKNRFLDLKKPENTWKNKEKQQTWVLSGQKCRPLYGGHVGVI